jgi:hypothetical protein
MSDQPIPSEPQMPQMPTELPPHAITFVLDGIAQDTIYTQDRFAAILLSNPIIVKTTGLKLIPGESKYDAASGLFLNPDGTPITSTSAEDVVPPIN